MAKGSGTTRYIDKTHKNHDKIIDGIIGGGLWESINLLKSNGYEDLANGLEGWMDATNLYNTRYNYSDRQRSAFEKYVDSHTHEGVIYRGTSVDESRIDDYLRSISGKSFLSYQLDDTDVNSLRMHGHSKRIARPMSFTNRSSYAEDYATQAVEFGAVPVIFKYSGKVKGVDISKKIRVHDGEVVVSSKQKFKVKKIHNIDIDGFDGYLIDLG